MTFLKYLELQENLFSTYEHKVKKLDDSNGYIDLLWKGTILIEMKGRVKNLDKAYLQAIEYTHGLKQHGSIPACREAILKEWRNIRERNRYDNFVYCTTLFGIIIFIEI